jgi:hypothetical protein
MATPDTYWQLVQQHKACLKHLSDLLLEVRDDPQLAPRERAHLLESVADLIWASLLETRDRPTTSAYAGARRSAAPENGALSS